MKTYFIRHASELDIDKATIHKLHKEGIIAIHYPWAKDNPSKETDSNSLNPDHYNRSGKSALRTLLDISKNGGYICAEYRGLNPLIGYVEPNTPIELFEGVWGSKNKREGRIAILKSLKLAKYSEIDPVNYVSLSVARPRQGTLVRWPSVKKRIESIVNGKKISRSLEDLTPDQQETMCAEFLRFNNVEGSYFSKLETLLLPVGRTMKDIDIAGISESDKKILAQVTFGKIEDYKHKVDRLKKFKNSQDTELILFCRCDAPKFEDGIVVFPIQQVFKEFAASEQGQRWLNAIT